MLHYLQKIGRSLMIPIAVLPAASILKRVGEAHSDNPVLQMIVNVCKAGGGAIFDNLPIMFAIGIAIGLTAGQGVAALAATVGYLVFVKVLNNFDTVGADGNIEHLDTGVLGGILCGMIAAFLYERYKDIKLPMAIGFFGGRRFIPIITSITMVVFGVIMGMIWLPVQEAIRAFGLWIVSAGGVGVAIYGFANRLLIPAGLHHIINNIAWMQIGEFTSDTGRIVHGDLARYYAGDPQAGMFMTGFYPVMMFGLPAAALAMIRTAYSHRKAIILSVLLTGGLTSFLTGITEPLEFAFMFAAPLLYIVHAVLTGLSMALMYYLDVRLGFGFSAGFFDLLLTWHWSERPWMMLALGPVYFAVYYFVFYGLIRSMKLRTPGREEEAGAAPESVAAPKPKELDRAALILESIGGASNIVTIDACITRLRLLVRDETVLNEAELKRLGAVGTMRIGKGNVHVVFGTDSELIKESIKKMLPN